LRQPQRRVLALAESVEFSRSLNPELQTLDQWMAANKDRIPLGGAG